MYDKYGQQMNPWECLIKLHVAQLEDHKEIIYSYSKKDAHHKDYIYEREPSRLLEIQPPETYSGELGLQKSSQWKSWDKVWIVNGHIEKTDGNFLGDLAETKIGETGISIGPYPLCENDVVRLKQSEVTSVLNLLCKNEYRQRGINWQKLQACYKMQSIKTARVPVNDMKEKELQSNLFIAAQHLHNMLNVEGQNVHVHCSSGLTRAPEVVVVYLCLFKKHKCWQSPEDVAHFVKAFNHKVAPNMRVINKCIQANLEFQKVQKDSTQLQTGSIIETGFYFPNIVVEESKHPAISEIDSHLEGSLPSEAHSQRSKQRAAPSAQNHKSELSPEKQIIPNHAYTPLEMIRLQTEQRSPSPAHSSRSMAAASASATTSKFDQESQLSKRVEQEVAGRLQALAERLKRESDQALEAAIADKLKIMESLDQQLKMKDRALQELQERKRAEDKDRQRREAEKAEEMRRELEQRMEQMLEERARQAQEEEKQRRS